jgi:hypothetical protein
MKPHAIRHLLIEENRSSDEAPDLGDELGVENSTFFG